MLLKGMYDYVCFICLLELVGFVCVMDLYIVEIKGIMYYLIGKCFVLLNDIDINYFVVCCCGV